MGQQVRPTVAFVDFQGKIPVWAKVSLGAWLCVLPYAMLFLAFPAVRYTLSDKDPLFQEGSLVSVLC